MHRVLNPRPGTCGVEAVAGSPARAPNHGVQAVSRLQVPPWEEAVYYAPYQTYDPRGAGIDWWPDGTNRMQALHVTDFRNLKRGGLQVTIRLQQRSFLVLIAMATPHTLSWFCSEKHALHVKAGNLGQAPVNEEIPMLAWSCDTDVYTACRRAWETAVMHPACCKRTRLRRSKNYPDIFRYLGWCSWEQYKWDINEAVLTSAVQALEKSPAPVRYMLVDDGHRQSCGLRGRQRPGPGSRVRRAYERPDQLHGA